jgi:L-asparagine oxygenase
MTLNAVDKSTLLSEGFLFLPRHRVGMSGHDVATEFGELLALGGEHAVHELTPTDAADATPNTYSGIYGLDVFPFHTDLAHRRDPPRYLMLRCIVGFEQVPTLLLDGLAVVEAVGETALGRALVKPRRPVAGRFNLLTIFERRDANPKLRWDETFLRAASPLGQIGLDGVRDAIRNQKPIPIALRDPADTLLVDNWRMLHARSSIFPGCEGRRIERVYLGDLH